MPFTVQEFRSSLKYDGARPNLFEVNITFPETLVNSSASGTQITFMCRAAAIPGSTVNPIPVNYFGRELKFAGNRTFQDWMPTIINDEDFLVRNTLEDWMNRLNSHRGNLRDSRFVAPWNYQADGTVKHFGKAGNVLKTYKIIGMFPTDISQIDLDWASNDTMEEYTVTFAYQWWEQIKGDLNAEYNVTIV